MLKPLTIAALLCCTTLACTQESTEQLEDAPQTPEIDKTQAAQATQEGKADLSLDWCKARGWYGDGVCDWFCPRRDEDCDPAPLGPEPDGSATTYPILLHHGFNAGARGMWSFYKVKEALEADGHIVMVTSVPPFASVRDRALALSQQIDELMAQTGASHVNLVAHSMGGLDARHLISTLGYGDEVVSLTTISTPHRGSAVADIALKILPGKLDDVTNMLAKLWGRTYSEVAEDSDVRAALKGISTKELERFNLVTPNDNRVYYQSWAGVSSVFGIANGKDLKACDYKLLGHDNQPDVMNAQLIVGATAVAGGTKLIPNDGMVAVKDAKWGNFQGCIVADHLDEVGQPSKDGPDKHTGFDHVRFYRNLAFDLADRGY